jgi:hypothetical protein
MTQPQFDQDKGPIEDVREGMPVLDAAGEKLGEVAFVTMGDPEAVTGAGQELPTGDDVLGSAARAAFGGSGLPPQLAERLRRTGYLRVDKGAFSRDAYVGAGQVAAVRDGTVHLRVTRDGVARLR